MNDLTEYERQRLAHIRRNQEFMARLGIQTKMQALEAVQLSTVPKTPKNKMDRVVRDDTRQVCSWIHVPFARSRGAYDERHV